MTINCSFIRTIGGYQWLLVPILLVAIILMAIDDYYCGGYSINGYWRLLLW
jgi:hypothetical protein